MRTPRTIVQTWKTEKLPKHLQKVWDMWDRWCRMYGYRHVLYTDDDLRNVVAKHFPQYVQLYDEFTNPLERVDFARYAIMYVTGGMYTDLDVIPLRNLDEWVSKGRVVLGVEPVEHRELLYEGRPIVLCNAVIISPPKEKIWLDLMEYISKNYKPYSRVVYNTGPMAMTNMYYEKPSLYKDVVIAKACAFFPLLDDRYGGKTQSITASSRSFIGEDMTFDNVSRECDLNESYTAHMWNHDGYQGFDMEFLDPKNWAIALFVILLVVVLFPPKFMCKRCTI